jgi:hypothetical protein
VGMRLFLPSAVIMIGGYSISIDARPIFQLYSVHMVLQQATQRSTEIDPAPA